MANRIRLRRGLDANVPAIGMSGEIFLATDVGRLHYSDGTAVAPLKVASLDITGVNAANGVLRLDAAGLVPTAHLPPLSISDVHVVADIAARDALTVEEGDTAVVTSIGRTFIYDGATWHEVTAGGAVTSVNGQTGTVNLALNDIADVDTTGAINGQVLQYDGANWIAGNVSTNFLGLSDTPDTYTGNETFLVRVSSTGTELEFTDEIDGGTF